MLLLFQDDILRTLSCHLNKRADFTDAFVVDLTGTNISKKETSTKVWNKKTSYILKKYI